MPSDTTLACIFHSCACSFMTVDALEDVMYKLHNRVESTFPRPAQAPNGGWKLLSRSSGKCLSGWK